MQNTTFVSDCDDLSDPMYGTVTYNSTLEGACADYTCDRGYDLIGINVTCCQPNARWSNTGPTCKIRGKLSILVYLRFKFSLW